MVSSAPGSGSHVRVPLLPAMVLCLVAITVHDDGVMVLIFQNSGDIYRIKDSV
jgi:hypothetical protein